MSFAPPVPFARLAGALSLAAGLGLSAACADAQSLGFEAGLAGVENHAATTPALGVSAFLPLTDRFKGVVAYSHWIGCDGGECDGGPRAGYGNQGLNVLGLFRVAGGAHGMNASLGAGAGWYEMLRLRDGESDAYYREALTFSGEIRLPVAFNSAAYVRGDLSFPEDDRQPRWGFLRVGVDVGRF